MIAGFDLTNVIRLPSPPRWLRWLAVAVVAGGLFVASVLTPPSGGVPDLGPLGLVGFDKWLHIAGYAGLGAVLFFAVIPSRRPAQAFVVAVALAAVYGVGIELVQGPLPARSADPLDAVANGVGAVLGGGVALVVRRLIHPQQLGRDTGTADD